jgi:hypothetical protein
MRMLLVTAAARVVECTASDDIRGALPFPCADEPFAS